MAINIIATRDAGDNPGPDIIDPLCTTDEVAVQRGTQFIDKNHKSRIMVTTKGPLRSWMNPGSLIEVTDAELASFRALLTGISISLTKDDIGFTADMDLQLEKLNV